MKKISKLTPFGRFCCTIGNLPTSYMESLTYEQQLLWLCKYLEETVIPAVNNNGEAVEELQNLYEELKTYVDNYFTNLDVQDEINNKLDEMAKSGQLTSLIKSYIDPLFNTFTDNINSTVETQNEKIIIQDSKLSNFEDKLNSISNGSPAGVYSTVNALETADPPHDRIYLVLADNKWYYYNNGWTAGGVYQSSGLGNNVEWYNQTNNLLNLEGITSLDLINETLNFVQGSINGGNGANQDSTTRIRSNNYFEIQSNMLKVEIPSTFKISIFKYEKSNNHYVSTIGWKTGINTLELDNTYKYRIIIAYANDDEIQASAYTNVHLFDGYNTNTKRIELIESEISDLQEPISYDDLNISFKDNVLNIKEENIINKFMGWELGSINSSTGGLVTSNIRVRSIGTYKFKNDKIKITIPEGYRIRLFKYNDYNQVSNRYLGNTGWITESGELEVDNTVYYRVVLASVNDIELDPSIKDNYVITDLVNYDNNLRKTNNNIPKLIMHRGMTCIRSENTLPAYYTCNRYGIKYVKCDIQVTSDHKYICSHQEKMQAPFVTPATNTYIKQLTLDEIQSNYYISGPMYDVPYRQKLRMPSFEEALVTFRENNIIPFIDVKTGDDYQYIYDTLVKYGFKENIYLFTSRKEVITNMINIDKNIKAFLWGSYNNENITFLLNLNNIDVGLACDYSELSKDKVQLLHSKGIEVGTYPVNDYTNIQNLIDMGVDYIQSDTCQFNISSDFRPVPLEFTAIGAGNYSLTIPDNQALIFNDYLQVELEVYYEEPYELTITIGEKVLVDNKPGQWHKIKMQKIKLNYGLNLSIECTDPNFMFLDRKVTLYTSK